MNLLRRIDRYGIDIPAFNIKGKEQVKTVFGGVMTLAIVIFTIGYFF